MPAPRLSSSAVDRSNTSTWQPRSRRTSAAVNPPSEPPTTATRGHSLTGTPRGRPCPPASRALVGGARQRLGLPEGGDAVDAALEQHPPLVHGRVAQPIGRLGAGVLGPRLVDGLGGPVPLDRVVLMDLPLDGGFDADPVVGVLRVHQQHGHLRVAADPLGLAAVLGQVEQNLVPGVVEPDRRQPGASIPAHHRDHGRHRLVEQLPVHRVQVLKGRLLLPRPDRELVFLHSLGDVEDLGDLEGHGTLPSRQSSNSTVTNRSLVSPAFSRSWTIGSAREGSEYWVSPTWYRRTLRVPSGDRCRPVPPSTTVQKYRRVWAWNGPRSPGARLTSQTLIRSFWNHNRVPTSRLPTATASSSWNSAGSKVSSSVTSAMTQTLIQARCARRTVVDRDHLAVLPPDGPHPVAHLAPAGIQGEAPQQRRGPPPQHSLGRHPLTVGGVGQVARSRGLGRHIGGLTASPTLVAAGEVDS